MKHTTKEAEKSTVKITVLFIYLRHWRIVLNLHRILTVVFSLSLVLRDKIQKTA